jgi:hypothetical protein
MFGQKYKVEFNRQCYLADKKVSRLGACKVSTEKEWYYSISCKYGDIAISSDRDDLYFYCKSARVARTIEREMSGKLCNCQITDIDAMIYFKLEHIKEIFKYAKPRRKKQLNDEQKSALVSNLEKYRQKKQENAPKNHSD